MQILKQRTILRPGTILRPYVLATPTVTSCPKGKKIAPSQPNILSTGNKIHRLIYRE